MNEHPTDAQNLRGASLIIPCFEWNKPSAETLMVKEEILDPCDLHLRLFETLTGNSPPVKAFRACQKKSLSAGALRRQHRTFSFEQYEDNAKG